jgi:hypothetical protein
MTYSRKMWVFSMLMVGNQLLTGLPAVRGIGEASDSAVNIGFSAPPLSATTASAARLDLLP